MLAGTTTSSPAAAPPPPLQTLDPDFAVILAALLCALICVLGLVAVARCAWIRRFSSFAASATAPSPNKGLKKKVLKALPSMTYRDDGSDQKLTECAICLAEFASGEEIRVLPQCGHGFHIDCIDTWLASHSSCPSCRQVLVVSSRCKNCGENDGMEPEPRENPVNRFLP